VPGEIVCSFAELDVLGDALRVNVRQFPFAVPHLGQSVEERVRLVETVHRDLLARGLVQGGEFAPDLAQALNVFARGHVAIAMVGHAGEVQRYALAAADDRTGVVAVQHGESIRFDLMRPESIVRGLLGLLPSLRPGPGASVTITDTTAPASRRRAAEEDFSESTFTTSVKAVHTTSAAQREAAEEILRRPRLGGGYFLVTARRNGESELGTVNWLDTDAGRYAAIPSTGDGQVTVTYMPADLARLDHLLTRIVNSPR
jgi:hypothetical protein